jgi:hypothetical protein
MKAFYHMSFAIVIIAVCGVFLCGFSKKVKADLLIDECHKSCVIVNGVESCVSWEC